jgi:ribonuclease P protein component
MKAHGFSKPFRLRADAEFQRVYNRRRSAADSTLIVYACENGLAHSRLGRSVSKKVGDAVTRNRWRRLIREAFRLSRPDLPVGYDFVVIPRSPASPSLQQVRQSFIRCVRQATRKITSETSNEESK